MSYFFRDQHFVIENYDKKKTFSSFLPGIAGIKGIPLWAYYANRGQGMTSFGIKDKNEPILEFFPANTSYQYVDTYGFRSFVKIDGEVYEPFAVDLKDDVTRNMSIARGHFSIEEINRSRQLHYKVTYFGLTNEPLAGLIRKVEVTNMGGRRTIEIVDGLANILPSGASTEGYKNMSNLMVSWMGVENLENDIPFYKFRASSGDEAEVSMVQKGHFYLSFTEEGRLIKPIVDLELIFGYDTSLSVPVGLSNKSVSDIDLTHQVLVNKVPCGFSPVKAELGEQETLRLNTIIGHVSDVTIINQKSKDIMRHAFIDEKLIEAESVIDDLVSIIETESRYPLFDEYLKQNLLDNTLRGGYPLIFGEGENQKIYHVFSRKHGDPERDYNFFTLSPEFYSQGNGNYRDVNQNRRNDVFFVPEAGLFNVKMFMNLLQIDGYNPLGVQGTTFTLDADMAKLLLKKHVVSDDTELMKTLSGKFSPGKISMQILLDNTQLKTSESDFITEILEKSTQHIEAVFGEGYWVDHFTYNFDLIESYLSVYPDNAKALLYNDSSYRFFESPVQVLPRNQKYGLTQNGVVRQFGSIREEEHTQRFNQSNWLKTKEGDVYETHLAEKLLMLILNKCSCLDPFGLGLEMEANKPGWNDAMNGLPGVFGSGVSESIELVRVVRFLKKQSSQDIEILKEGEQFFRTLSDVLNQTLSDYERWDALSTAREQFRATVLSGISGEKKMISHEELVSFLERVERVLVDGIERAKKWHDGIIPTYITYEVSEYEILDDVTPYGLKAVKANAFELRKIPHFLEAPARSFKIASKEENYEQYLKIKETDIYDQTLKTYKTSVKLDEMSYELGRIRAFTPGWLERESNFLHMTYKYLLGLLKGGLYDVFYEEIQTNLVCFMNPEVYGRSTLENSSFIASSLNPNPKVHGQGFVSRLSGSTAEMLSIWQYMMFGARLFNFDEQHQELVFSPRPILHQDFFKEGRIKTKLLSQIDFIIENHTGHSTYSDKIFIAGYVVDGKAVEEIRGQLALDIRNRVVKQVIVKYKHADI